MRPSVDERRMPRVLGHLSLFTAAVVSLFVTYSLKAATTAAAIVLGVWLLLPYVALGAILETRTSAVSAMAAAVTAFLVAAGGVALLILVVFVTPDAQSAIAVVLTPIYQTIATAVLLPITYSVCAKSVRRRAC